MEDFDLADIIRLALEAERDDIHTAMPGKVVAYDPTKQTADVQLMLKRTVFEVDGTRLDGDSFPVLPSVPVIWPRAGGFVLTMPLTAGDFVWVMFSEGGTGEFRATGQESEPFDVSRHTISYPYCMPGAIPDTAASTDTDVVAGAKMVIGKAGDQAKILISPGTIQLGATATDHAALASLVDSAVSQIVTAFNAHTHTSAAPGNPTTPPVTLIAPAPGSVAATVTKVE